MEITRETLGNFRISFIAAMETLEVDYGIKVELGQINYSPSNATASVQISSIDGDGVVNTRQREDYLMHCSFLGLNKDWIDKEFAHNGSIFKITGLKPKSRKYPVMAERTDGKTFKFPTDLIIPLMAKAA